ncbi:opsin 9 [Erpetoichthys calabaricus]|uniref:opsin 9 n=1 Tax=Erpetoichthys calabaricus TaxID=27687 RepID=UPI00109F281C|nr:opsin 9 [Erpetoichthys calabaricus]
MSFNSSASALSNWTCGQQCAAQDHNGTLSESKFKSALTPAADLVIGVFIAVTGLLSITGNGLVIAVFSHKNRRLKAPEFMVMNLAVCDFGYALLGAPFLMYSSFVHKWAFGSVGCTWYGIQGFVFGIGSLLTTMLISIDRCLKICSIKYGQWVECHHITGLILSVWLYTLTWAILPVFGFGSYGPEPFGTSCTIDWWKVTYSANDRLYVILIMAFCFGIPTCIIVFCYVKIIFTARASSRFVASISASTVTGNANEMKLTKIAAVICSTFFLAWSPYVVVSFYSALQSTSVPNLNANAMSPGENSLPRLPPELSAVPALFAKSHCMVNPLIYHIMNQDFHSHVRSLFSRGSIRSHSAGGSTKFSSLRQSTISRQYSLGRCVSLEIAELGTEDDRALASVRGQAC